MSIEILDRLSVFDFADDIGVIVTKSREERKLETMIESLEDLWTNRKLGDLMEKRFEFPTVRRFTDLSEMHRASVNIVKVMKALANSLGKWLDENSFMAKTFWFFCFSLPS